MIDSGPAPNGTLGTEPKSTAPLGTDPTSTGTLGAVTITDAEVLKIAQDYEAKLPPPSDVDAQKVIDTYSLESYQGFGKFKCISPDKLCGRIADDLGTAASGTLWQLLKGSGKL